MTKNVLIIAGIILGLIIMIAGIRVVILIRNLNGYKNYWQKETIKPFQDNDLVYVAMGDSAAQGIGASSPRRGYVGLVAEHIGSKTGKKVHVVNISVSGAKLRDVIRDQLPQLQYLTKANYFTIEAGANDMGTFDETKFRNEFAELLKGLQAGTYVSNIPSFKGGRRANLNQNAQRANEIIASHVAGRKDLKLVDLYNETKGQRLWDFGADLFHPSNSGYKNWAKAFNSSIDSK